MGNRSKIFVFAYDIKDDARRRRVSNILEDHLVRVQMSVFEGRLPPSRAKFITRKLKSQILPGDKLRVYAVPIGSLADCARYGGAPLPEAQDFWLM